MLENFVLPGRRHRPEDQHAPAGRSTRMYLPSRHASSHAIIGESIAYRLPGAALRHDVPSARRSASSIALRKAVSTCVPYCIRIGLRQPLLVVHGL